MRTLYCSILFLTASLFAADPVNVAGTWQISWDVRLGTAHATVQLKQDGGKLSGTFQQTAVSAPLSGSVQGKNISFDVDFPGPRPYTIEFTGAIDGEKISGKSRAKGVEGGGAYPGTAAKSFSPTIPGPQSARRNPKID